VRQTLCEKDAVRSDTDIVTSQRRERTSSFIFVFLVLAATNFRVTKTILLVVFYKLFSPSKEFESNLSSTNRMDRFSQAFKLGIIILPVVLRGKRGANVRIWGSKTTSTTIFKVPALESYLVGVLSNKIAGVNKAAHLLFSDSLLVLLVPISVVAFNPILILVCDVRLARNPKVRPPRADPAP
jgi:hypothetical protein